ncbi:MULTISPECIES: hypothetical protein [unclassified Paraflavitalea]|uniref:hypothetical protein n=1 Tax=unclassified Paraflavitalea TaxID=2798305 RepID=UPI003D33A68C
MEQVPNTPNKTDLELANEALVAIKPNISAEDRKGAPASTPVISIYLNGRGRDLDMAMKLLSYFRAKVQERRQEIIKTAV